MICITIQRTLSVAKVRYLIGDKVQPKIVVCLGRIASQRMIRTDFSVTKEHGIFVQKNGVWFMGTFHPAALLRQAQNKPAAFADFVALRDKIHEVCGHTY